MRALTFSFIAIAGWAALASAASHASAMPKVDGEYEVGVIRAEFVDPSRRLEPGDPLSGPRRLPAIVWYPAAQGGADSTAYFDGAAATVTLPAIARNFGYSIEDLQALQELRMEVRSGSAPAKHPQGFPVVLFSHGLLLYPEQNSALLARLASHGYIVLSIAHPGDAADVRLDDGRVVVTRTASKDDDPRFAEAFKALIGGADLDIRRQALIQYAEALPATRIGRSFGQWRDDTLAVARAIVDGKAPRGLHEVLAAADRDRLAFVGMSFGGATSATSCKRVAACRAAVNLDGQNFDPELFDGPVERPLLLLLSDWTRYSLFPGQPQDADFSPNDLAYESWNETGKNPAVTRVRLEGIRHIGFTDLVALLEGPKRNERVGEIEGREALSAIGDLVLAFLNAHLRGDDGASIDPVMERHPGLKRHTPTRLKHWVSEQVR